MNRAGEQLWQADIVITMDPERRVLSDGAVLVRDERIVEVGPFPELQERHPEVPCRRHPHGVMLPGLIDSHGHAGHAFVRMLGTGRSDAWADVCEEIYARASAPRFWHLDGYLLGLERLHAGITSGVTLFGGGGQILTGDMPLRTDSPEYAELHAQALAEIGTREWLVVGPRRPPFPRRYVRWNDGVPIEVEVSFEDQVRVCRDLVAELHGTCDGRMSMGLMTHTVHPDLPGEEEATRGEMTEQARTVRALAAEHGIPFMQDGHTRGTIRYANAHLGGLGPDMFLSHATDLDPDEIRLCAQSGAVVVHNPSAIASVLGRCPVPELLESGARVVIGSDGPGPDRGCDLFRHMFHAIRAQRAHRRDPELMPEAEVLALVTIEAAEALGRGNDIGSLEAGKRADLLVIDADRPHLTPLTMPVEQIVQYAGVGDVHTVLVDGRVVLEAGTVAHVDEARALAQAREEWRKTLERAELPAALGRVPGVARG